MHSDRFYTSSTASEVETWMMEMVKDPHLNDFRELQLDYIKPGMTDVYETVQVRLAPRPLEEQVVQFKQGGLLIRCVTIDGKKLDLLLRSSGRETSRALVLWDRDPNT
jgi:hypothetical protein